MKDTPTPETDAAVDLHPHCSALSKPRRKRTPEQIAKWNESEAGRACRRKYQIKKREESKSRAKLSKPLGRKIRAMKAEGWQDTTIAVVMKISVSVIQAHLQNDKTQP